MTREPAQRGEMAYRLGWALYWICIVVGVLWLAFMALIFANDVGLLAVVLFGGIPALLAYGLGRALRYVLSGE